MSRATGLKHVFLMNVGARDKQQNKVQAFIYTKTLIGESAQWLKAVF